MKELELLTLLTNVKSEYIMQAQALRSGEKRATIRLLSRKRTLLIAAVISLLLLLVGCAAVLISLQKVSLGHWVFTGSWNEPFEMDVISLNGYTDSPEYRATLEWMEFENSYDPDKALLHQADVNHYMPSSDYESYLCYTEEMRGKIDEICQKYDLELAGPEYFPEKSEQSLEAVNVSSIENESAILSLYLNEGRYYRSGSLRTVAFTVPMDGADCSSTKLIPSGRLFQQRMGAVRKMSSGHHIPDRYSWACTCNGAGSS